MLLLTSTLGHPAEKSFISHFKLFSLMKKVTKNQEETILPPALLEQKNCKQSWINLFATVYFVPPFTRPELARRFFMAYARRFEY
jgi:hypothetical protein